VPLVLRNDKAIIERRTRLRKLQADAENKHFPDGFQPAKSIVDLATRETQAYFQTTFSAKAKY
jgi:hypothetical protein